MDVLFSWNRMRLLILSQQIRAKQLQMLSAVYREDSVSEGVVKKGHFNSWWMVMNIESIRYVFQRLLNMPVLSHHYRWVKQCHRSPKTWTRIHTEFLLVSVLESHRMYLVCWFLKLFFNNWYTIQVKCITRKIKASNNVFHGTPWVYKVIFT